MPAVLVTFGNRGQNPPRLIITPRRVTAMAITENEIQNIQIIS